MKLRDLLKTYKNKYGSITIIDNKNSETISISISDAIEKYGNRSVRLWDMTKEYSCGYQKLEVCIV